MPSRSPDAHATQSASLSASNPRGGASNATPRPGKRLTQALSGSSLFAVWSVSIRLHLKATQWHGVLTANLSCFLIELAGRVGLLRVESDAPYLLKG